MTSENDREVVGQFSSAFFTSSQPTRKSPSVPCPVNVPLVTSARLAVGGAVRGVIDRIDGASLPVNRDPGGRSSIRPCKKGRFDGGEGRGRSIRPVRSPALPREAPQLSDGLGATPGGEAVRPPQEPHGAGDRIESRGRRRHAENVECASP